MERFLRLTVLMFLIPGAAVVCIAQSVDASSSSPSSRPKEDVPQPVLEQLAKKKSDDEKREFKELTDNAAKTSEIAKEVLRNYTEVGRLSDEDVRRIDRIERLARKVRSILGGSGDPEAESIGPTEKPETLGQALESLNSSAASFSDEVKRCTRYSVTVAAIDESNRVLELISIIRKLR